MRCGSRKPYSICSKDKHFTLRKRRRTAEQSVEGERRQGKIDQPKVKRGMQTPRSEQAGRPRPLNLEDIDEYEANQQHHQPPHYPVKSVPLYIANDYIMMVHVTENRLIHEVTSRSVSLGIL